MTAYMLTIKNEVKLISVELQSIVDLFSQDKIKFAVNQIELIKGNHRSYVDVQGLFPA